MVGVRTSRREGRRAGSVRVPDDPRRDPRGCAVLYRDRPSGLTSDELAYGLVLADVATHIVLGLQAGAPPDTVHTLLANEPPYWAEVHQATGMLSIQLNVPLDEAFVRLRAHAFATDTPLRDLAREVVARRMLDPDLHR
jgi:hypothetical protein